MNTLALIATLLMMLTNLAFVNPQIQPCDSTTEADKSTTETDKKEIIWNYSGDQRPARWGELSQCFVTCSNGKTQSPINLSSAIPEEGSNLVFNYQDTPLTIINNGHTIEVEYASGSTVTIGNKEYELKQFHFHAPSEHTIKGTVKPMELHLVHKNQNKEIAVVGILIEQDEKHPIIEKIWPYISLEQGKKKIPNVTINAIDFIPKEQSYYKYIGSLTTPPCTEGVNWFVFKQPIQLSAEQIKQFRQIYQLNARPVQPLDQHKIVITQE
ncbi:carbonic anhydrase [Gloeothece verrucosa]|uniref:carbonic anhydrase n=1 Tax=Gloeothece verrucosa (strain PCC 7822) TaxID=497965 RepID=E0UHC7_GLOV7|nr:carbonic anhydrase family protein [Gloeothece verrucosa]ADN16841.1 Carbonate dehydratase [Gloeothece verrucosa PCC 7822]